MRRWGNGEAFLGRIEQIRVLRPDAAFRSNFIVGYPGETEEDHDQLLAFVEEAQLDWCGFFSYSTEDGTYAAGLDGAVDPSLVADRLAELGELQDRITAAPARRPGRHQGRRCWWTSRGSPRSHREAPEIDGDHRGARGPGRRGVPPVERRRPPPGPDLTARAGPRSGPGEPTGATEGSHVRAVRAR